MAKQSGRRAADRPELTRLELDIMDVVWELGECSSAEVTGAYTKKRPLAPTTIRSVLANLRKKGYLEPVPTIERGFRLRALVARDTVARRTLRGLVQSLFGGSPQAAIAYLLKDEDIDEADLQELRRIIDSRRGGKGK